MGQIGQVDAVQLAAPFQRLIAAGAFDEDPAHRFSRSGKEVAAAIPRFPRLLIRLTGHQTQVGLMNQGRGLQRLAGLLLSQILGCEFTQLVVDQRQQLLRGLRIALFDGEEDAKPPACEPR